MAKSKTRTKTNRKQRNDRKKTTLGTRKNSFPVKKHTSQYVKNAIARNNNNIKKELKKRARVSKRQYTLHKRRENTVRKQLENDMRKQLNSSNRTARRNRREALKEKLRVEKQLANNAERELNNITRQMGKTKLKNSKNNNLSSLFSSFSI